MTLKQIIYTSTPFGYDHAILSGILLSARRWNERDNISGALICRHDVFLQLLEGPADKIDAAYARIAKDDRHVNITQIVSEIISERMFGEWDMRHDPAQTWFYTAKEVADGVLDDASPDDIKAVFVKLAKEPAGDQLD